MIYLTCPTCGYFIGNKIEQYETHKNKICNTKDIREEEKGKQIQTLIKSLNLRRYCCRMRLLSCSDIVQDILPVNS
uniref:DNA-directed RNA polymerase subunit N n=1 Tax=Megaviridae environmental sample TaxID=1737588 RepID=A0A5J6VM10_9VIRU|nr:MAG: hypothetical protein [Megaviridae environmental sample]